MIENPQPVNNSDFEKFINKEKTPQSTYWEFIPFLHLGFGLFNLMYLPLTFFVLKKVRLVLENPEIKELVMGVYGTDFLWLFGENATLKWVSIILILLTSGVNFVAVYLIRKSGSRKSRKEIKYIRWVAWFNIGIPPWGTALGLMSFHLLKKDKAYFKSIDIEALLLQDRQKLIEITEELEALKQTQAD
jgi:hypothetical protein